MQELDNFIKGHCNLVQRSLSLCKGAVERPVVVRRILQNGCCLSLERGKEKTVCKLSKAKLRRKGNVDIRYA